jgi:hypothetical protein
MGGWFGGKPKEAGCSETSCRRSGLRLLDEDAEDPAPVRQVADPAVQLGGDPVGEEPLQPAPLGVQDADGGVARPRHLARRAQQLLQDRVEVQPRDQDAAGVEDLPQPGGVERVHGHGPDSSSALRTSRNAAADGPPQTAASTASVRRDPRRHLGHEAHRHLPGLFMALTFAVVYGVILMEALMWTVASSSRWPGRWCSSP